MSPKAWMLTFLFTFVIRSIVSGLFFVFVYKIMKKIMKKIQSRQHQYLAVFLCGAIVLYFSAYWFVSLRPFLESTQSAFLFNLSWYVVSILTNYALLITQLITFIPRIFIFDNPSLSWLAFESAMIRYITPVIGAGIVTYVYHLNARKRKKMGSVGTKSNTVRKKVKTPKSGKKS